MNRVTDATAVRLAASLRKLDDAGRAPLQGLSLCLNHLGQTGCHAIHETLVRVRRPGLVVVYGNPGHDGRRSHVVEATKDPFKVIPWLQNEREVYEEATKNRNLRPIRSGDTSQTDSKTNLMNLRVPTPFLSPRSREALSPRGQYDTAHGSESYLRTTSRKAAAREERKKFTHTSLHQRQKTRQMEETGRIKYAPDDRLPPLSFQKQARDLNRFNRKVRVVFRLFAGKFRLSQARLARLAGKERNDELAKVKSKLMESISSQRLRDAIAGKDYDSDEERERRPGARATRAVADVYKYFPNVVATDGAIYGRIDLSKERFGRKAAAPASTKASDQLKKGQPANPVSTRSLLDPNHA